MSTAVKNEYAVDHTDGLHTDLPRSFREFREKYLPKGSKDRFERMADEHAAHIKFLHEQYGEQIKEKEKTIARWRERVLNLENGDTFKAKEEQLKHQEQLNSDLRFQIQSQELTNSVEIEKLTTKLNNCVSNFRQLEKENNDLTENVRRLEKEKEYLKTSCVKEKNDLRTYCKKRMLSLERENKQLSQIWADESRKQNNEIKYLTEEIVKMALEVKEYKLENVKLKEKVDAPITTRLRPSNEYTFGH